MADHVHDDEEEEPMHGVESDDAVVASEHHQHHSPAPRRGCAFAAFVESALADVSTAAASCRGQHYKDVRAACQAALGKRKKKEEEKKDESFPSIAMISMLCFFFL